MKVRLIVIGRTVEDYLRKGEAVYVDRLKHYAPFEVVEIPDLKGLSAMSEAMVKEKEGDALMKILKPSDYVILLDERGKSFTSTEWARDLEHKSSHLSKDLSFVIGGPYGFHQKVYERADEKISLSKMTFSHQMVRMIFLEQLYRAFTIIKGEPYHHE